MSRADADVVRRDRDLPDLGLLLDPDHLAAGLARMGGQRRIAGVTVTYLRYKPGQSCVAACRADVDGQPVDMIAKTYRPSAIGKVQKDLMRPTVPGPLGAGRFLLDNTNVVVSVFPNDSKVERLARLMTPESLAELAARIGYRLGAGDRLEALRHNPERRFVGRLIANGTAIATVRCYTAHDYAGVVEKARALRSRGPLKIPSRLTRMHRLRVLAFEWIPGDVLQDAITRRSVRPDMLEVVGAALAHLHSQESATLPRRTGTAEAAAVVAIAEYLGRLHPPVAGLVHRLTGRLAAVLAEETTTPRPLHGDFYAQQVVLAGGTAALIDLDEASLGDPAVDLARFRADLEASAVSGTHAADIDALVEPLLSGYRRTRSLPARLEFHTASQLIRLAAHPFRRREASWPDIVTAILERAETFLNCGTKASAPRVAVSAPERERGLTADRGDVLPSPHIRPVLTSDPRVIDPFGITNDPLMPFLTEALRPEQMAHRFARTLGAIDAAPRLDVLGISVTRYKPGLRCLIAYDLALHHADGRTRLLSVMGKVRMQSADRSTHQLQEALWTGSFGARADDGILVPEPLGWISDVHMTLQRRVPGELFARLLDGSSGLWLARRAADAIHKLHCVVAPTRRRRHTVDDEIRILHERLTAVSNEHPLWKERIARLFEGCVHIAAAVRETSVCGIHRDFYPDQLLADGDRVYLTDLDLYREGPPALDVGNFVAHVQEESLRRFGNERYLADRNDMLVERYLQLSGQTTREDIEVWTTLSLARLVAISTQFAERRPFTEPLLDLCERRVFSEPVRDRMTGLAYGASKGVGQ